MLIAVVGAGRVGSTFAFHLARAGHELTLIARGKRLEALQSGQIVSTTGEVATVTSAAQLDVTVAYDLVLVTVMAHQLEAVLPALEASRAKKVLFLFNDFDPTERLRQRIGAERARFGFPTVSAFFVDGKLKSQVTGPGMNATLDDADAAAVLKQAGIPSVVEPDMDSFLRAHVAFVLPFLTMGCWTHTHGRSPSWSLSRQHAVAMKDGLRVVRSLGHSLIPGFVATLAKMPTFVLTLLVWLMSRTRAVKDLGQMGPDESRALIDAMERAAPGQLGAIAAIRP